MPEAAYARVSSRDLGLAHLAPQSSVSTLCGIGWDKLAPHLSPALAVGKPPCGACADIADDRNDQ